ncbi:hypothetical protein KKE60_08985 [Patescibacteria group bacterium]|nr:hypothetical protein [Patescibacteria group bacterium]
MLKPTALDLSRLNSKFEEAYREAVRWEDWYEDCSPYQMVYESLHELMNVLEEKDDPNASFDCGVGEEIDDEDEEEPEEEHGTFVIGEEDD